jgi:EAL domain-containing protein (putative c-di-GMP-specific phosphodiesterase class I)
MEREHFDVVIASERLGGEDSGVELLRRSLRTRPDALRILVIETEDLFAEVRGATLARVDYFVLQSDGPRHLAAAIEDGLIRRELSRQRLLSGADYGQQIYAAHLAELDGILERRALRFLYQPIRDARTSKLFAYEALCRVEHPVFSNPVAFFEAAIRSGNIWKLGRLVREIATAPLAELDEPTLLFVNLHPAEIDDPELAGEGCPGRAFDRRVVFEITERSAIPDFKRVRQSLSSLRERGCQFAIDDLGAGYASLNSVALLGPDFMKIDMTLIRDIQASDRKARLVRRIVEFANEEHIQVIAEGVESQEELEVVAAIGCHLVQGHFVGHPAPLRGGLPPPGPPESFAGRSPARLPAKG